jgi:cell division protein FtsI (penicillin-binding protein 3)
MVEVGSTGQMQVGPRMVNDAERQPKPVESVEECFAHSSNVGMSKLAYKAFGNNPKEFKDYIHRFHLDRSSPIDLKDIPKPRIAPLDPRNGGLMNMITMSFGYAIQISPLNTLALYNAIANNGKMMKPYLVNSIQADGKAIEEFFPTVVEQQICKPAVVNAAKECMNAVVQIGTGKVAFANMPFPVAGKTGTAHVADGNIKYDDGVYQATFVGYFPADHPQYTCIVVIRTRPHAPVHYGGDVAGPVFREIAIKLYAMYIEKKNQTNDPLKSDSSGFFYAGSARDVRTVYNKVGVAFRDSSATAAWSTVYSNRLAPVVRSNVAKTGIMPNIKGMGLKDVLFLLENQGVKVVSKGKGRVVSQSIPAGTQISHGFTVLIELG